MIPQPDWRKKESIQVFGEPRLGFLVTAGNMDSMVNHYTVSKKHRSTDAYSPGGKMGLRPDRASVVYSNLIRQTYKHTPIILGGIEASLRRMAHYDYWENKVKHSILIDSGADLISYGMGNIPSWRSQKPCKAGFRSRRSHMWQGRFLKATISAGFTIRWSFRHLSRYRPIKSLRGQLCHSVPKHGSIYSKASGRILWEPWICDTESTISASDQMEMDDVYDLPYTGRYHPMYQKEGGIPALKEIKFSLTSNRGCFGSCNFCAPDLSSGPHPSDKKSRFHSERS